jgi:hypothetical protein
MLVVLILVCTVADHAPALAGGAEVGEGGVGAG